MFYPTVREETILSLNVVVQALERDPTYLDNPDCPYSDTIKAFFRTKAAVSEAPIDLFADEEDLVVIDQQIQAVINDLEAFSKTLGNADHSEKLAYFKTKTTLIEKLISMKERVFNLKEVNEFRNTVLSLLDDVCDKDQVTKFMQSLDGILGTSNDDLRD